MKTCIMLAFKGGKREKIWEGDCETAAREAEENRRRCGGHNPCSALLSPTSGQFLGHRCCSRRQLSRKMRTEQYSLCLATRNSLINLARILPVESFLLFNTFYYGNFYMYTKVIGQYNKCSQTYNLARTIIIIFVFF